MPGPLEALAMMASNGPVNLLTRWGFVIVSNGRPSLAVGHNHGASFMV